MSASVDSSSRSLAKNALSQIIGRLCLSLGRLIAALMIVRVGGPERFGEYALILQFIFLFEWLSDFGQTDIAVRGICQTPRDETRILRGLAVLKLLQGGALAVLLPITLLAMGYPREIVAGGLLGSVSVACYAGVQVFRTLFKLNMVMERDIAAELGGLLAMLPLTWVACRMNAGVEVLVGCYALGRAVFVVLSIVFSRNLLPQGGTHQAFAAARELARLAWPLGVTGLLVALYDSLATVMLSKMTDLEAVARYAAATRFVFPVIIIVQALAAAFYPPLSANWNRSRSQFLTLQQSSLELSVLLGGFIFCGVYSSADFLMGLMGPSVALAAPVLRVMTLVVLARSITTAMSPLIIVSGKQVAALWLTGLSILSQATLLTILVPRHGIFGAAVGYLLVELIVGVVPVSVVGQLSARIQVRWSVIVRIVGCAGATVLLCDQLPFAGTFWSGALAGLLFPALVIGTGTISPRRIRAVLSELSVARAAAPSPAAERRG